MQKYFVRDEKSGYFCGYKNVAGDWHSSSESKDAMPLIRHKAESIAANRRGRGAYVDVLEVESVKPKASTKAAAELAALRAELAAARERLATAEEAAETYKTGMKLNAEEAHHWGCKYAELAVSLATAEADSRRLDWLEKQLHGNPFIMGTLESGFRFYTINSDGTASVSITHDTLRAAIDAATEGN
jgi:hypothetical protein